MRLKKAFLFSRLRYATRVVRVLRRRFLRLLGWKGRTAWIASPMCKTAFNGMKQHPEQSKRIDAIEKSLKCSPWWARMQKIVPNEVSDIQLARVHSRRYLNSLENQLSFKDSVKVEEDTYLTKDTLLAARYSAGAVVTAVDMVMRRHAKNAFCAVRPPGHHAFADKASGFCFINNIAVGVMHAIAEYRLKRIAIIDFDLHHGDGIEAIFRDDSRVMFLSSFEYPLYPFSGVDYNGSNPYVINSPLKAGTSSDEFRHLVRSLWLPKLASFRPQMIFLAAGFDAHRDDQMGHLLLDEEDFAWLTRKIVLIAERYTKGRIISVLEGGYDIPSLAISAKAHIIELIRSRNWF